jgi:hypothetical protein
MAREREAYGPKQIVLQVRPDTDFKSLVKQLELILTIPELPDFRGCSPCLSGLDKFVVQSHVLEQF